MAATIRHVLLSSTIFSDRDISHRKDDGSSMTKTRIRTSANVFLSELLKPGVFSWVRQLQSLRRRNAFVFFLADEVSLKEKKRGRKRRHAESIKREHPYMSGRKTNTGENNRKYRKEKRTPIFSCSFFSARVQALQSGARHPEEFRVAYTSTEFCFGVFSRCTPT